MHTNPPTPMDEFYMHQPDTAGTSHKIKFSPAAMQLINKSRGKRASPLPLIVLTCKESICVSPVASVSDRCLFAAQRSHCKQSQCRHLSHSKPDKGHTAACWGWSLKNPLCCSTLQALLTGHRNPRRKLEENLCFLLIIGMCTCCNQAIYVCLFILGIAMSVCRSRLKYVNSSLDRLQRNFEQILMAPRRRILS